MLPQFTSTAASLSRATTLISRVGTDADLYDEPETENLALLLDSKYEAEKSEGMKRLIALMSQGMDVSNFFPQVVKNVVTHSLELKKLVYIYLVHYAENLAFQEIVQDLNSARRPDEALLAMNTFQKDLSDLNPLVRAWALRAMSGIRVRVVLPLVVLAINKCARDPSPYVRRCAAHAISKVYSLDHEHHQDALEELICLLINDNSPGVIGAVAAAFTSVCPEKLSFWEPRYQKLCELLLNVDEWGQVILIDILLRYAVGRHGYPEGSIGLSLVQDEAQTQHNPREGKLKGRMEEWPPVADSNLSLEGVVQKKQMGTDGVGSSRSAARRELDFRISSESWLAKIAEDRITEDLQEDTALLLRCTLPLLQSHNSAVVMAAVGVHWLLASIENLKKIVKPVIFLLRSSTESQYVVLANIATFVKRAPSLFEAHYEEFFISSVDGEQIRTMKLDILCQIATEASIRPILREFQEYVRNPDRHFAANTVRAIGRCAFRLRSVAKVCTEALLVLASSGPSSHPQSSATEAGLEDEEDERSRARVPAGRAQKQLTDDKKINREALVVMEAVMALRAIIHEHPVKNEEVLVRLARGLDTLKVPEARTVVIWMVGEFGSVGTRLPKMIPVILQYLGGTFKKESDEAKLQILTCAAKVVLRLGMASDSSFSKTPLLILNYVLRLAALDLNYDIRDRARLYQHLLAFCLQNVALSEKGGGGRGIADKFHDLDLLESDGKEAVSAPRKDNAQRTLHSFLHELDNDKGVSDNKVILFKVAQKIFLMPKSAPILPSLAPDRSAFAPGTMSHIVLHRAPNYHPLPRPFSIERAPPSPPPPPVSDQRLPGADGDRDYSSNEYSGTESEDRLSDASSSRGSSHSFYEEDSASPHSSEGDDVQNQNRTSKNKISGRNKTKINVASSSRQSSQRSVEEKRRQQQQELGPLINLSDSSEAGERRGTGKDDEGQQQPVSGISSSAEFGLISAVELDLWLGSSEPSREDMPPSASETPSGYATIAVGRVEVKPKIQSLLDFTNGAGLDVKYSFDRPTSATREGLLSLKLYFENRSLDTLSDIAVVDAESGSSSPQSVSGANSVEEIESEEQGVLELEGGERSERKLSVHFGDDGKWIRLTILCSGKRYPVKIMPDIGAVIRPAILTPDEFALAESKLSGMYEALRRCSLSIPSRVGRVAFGGEEDQVLLVARAIAEKVQNTAHVSFVSTIMPIGDSQLGVHSAIQGDGDGLQGLSLQFSGKTLTVSALCLIRVTVLTEPLMGRDGGAHLDVIVKTNCEDTVYGLNLLREISKAFNGSD